MGNNTQLFAAGRQSRTPGRFMVVEDDPVCRQFCAVILATLGYEALLADNPKTALMHFRSTAIEGILLDWNIPHPGSLVLLFELFNGNAALLRAIPVIIMSADEQFSIKQLRAAGATGFIKNPAILKKPFTAADLLASVGPKKEISKDACFSATMHSRMKHVFLRHLRRDMLLLDEMISSNKQQEVLQLLHRLRGAASMMDLAAFGQLCMNLASGIGDPANNHRWTECYLQLIQLSNEMLADQHTTAEGPAN